MIKKFYKNQFKSPDQDYGKLNYNFVLTRWFFNYGWAWVIGFILSWINTLTVVYYLIPSVKESMSFSKFLFIGSIVLILTSTIIGWFLIKIMKVQSIETKIGTDVNPYAHTKLTQKEIALWSLIISTAEQVKELSKDSKEKDVLQKRIDIAKEYLSNKKSSHLDLLNNPDFSKEN